MTGVGASSLRTKGLIKEEGFELRMKLMFGLVYLIYVRVSTITAIWTVGHRLRSTPTNGHRFTALSLPWRSPIQVLTGLDVAQLQ